MNSPPTEKLGGKFERLEYEIALTRGSSCPVAAQTGSEASSAICRRLYASITRTAYYKPNGAAAQRRLRSGARVRLARPRPDVMPRNCGLAGEAITPCPLSAPEDFSILAKIVAADHRTARYR